MPVASAKRAQLLVGVAGEDAAADVDHGLLGGLDEAQDLLELGVRRLRRRRQAGMETSSGFFGKTGTHSCCWMSFGMSMTTGPGRPVVAILKALYMMLGSSL
jgi:hypothetical protein